MPARPGRPLLAAPGADLARGAALAAACGLAMGASLLAEPAPGGLLAAALVPVLVAIAVWDARLFLIPDPLSAAAGLLGLAHAAVTADGAGIGEAMLAAALRGAALAGLFLGLRAGYRALRGREGLGLGDVKLAAAAGIWLQPAGMAAAVEIAALSGLAAIAVRRLRTGRPLSARLRLPFGLFFAPAIWTAWMLERVIMGVS